MSKFPLTVYRLILAAFSTAFLLPAYGQGEVQGQELEEIVVTGSYLYSAVDSPSPVAVYDGADLTNFAPANMQQFFFDNVPQNYSSDNISQTDALGMARSRSIRNSSINLRGLGDENSLTVLNGRRTIAYPVPDGTGWLRTDINSLVPRIAVQRIELLLDGGSAIYGSDPVAGVANFVTNNSFRGFDMQLDSRTLEEATSAGNITWSGLFGAGGDNTDFIAALEYHKEDLVRRFEADPTFQTSPDVTPETGVGLEDSQGLRYVNAGGMNATGWVDPLCGDPQFGNFAYFPAYEDPADDEIRQVGTGSDPNAPAELCARPVNYDQGFDPYNNNVETIIAFMAVDHDFSDSLRINAEFNYADQQFDDVDQWGDGGTGAAWTPNTPTSLGFSFPVTAPAIQHAQSINPGFGMSMNGNIFTVNETMPYRAELPAFNNNDLIRFAAGLEGDFARNWTWLVDGSWAEQNVENGIRDVIVSRYQPAISGFGGPNCDPLTGTAGQGDCFYYNPFMSSAIGDPALANDPGLLEWLIPNRVDNFKSTFQSIDLRISGEFGSLPGGPIGAAFGVAYRDQSLERDADDLVNNGLMATTGIVNDFSGDQQVESVYFEFAMPLSDQFNLQLAARHESYDLGFSETSPKIAGIWTPNDRLTLRGSWGTSFKGPSISQTAAATQFQGGGPSNITVDNVTYGAMGMFNSAFETRPNVNLTPQTSDNLSFGFDFVVNDRINVGASWVSIDFKDRIVANTANVVTQQLSCIENIDGIPVTSNGMANGNLRWIHLDQGGCVLPVNANLPIDQNNIGLIVTEPVNLDYLNTQFLDVRANMAFDTSAGAISFTPNITYVLEYEFPLPGTTPPRAGLCPNDVCSSVGRFIGMGFANGINNMPRWQGNFPVNLSTGNHNFRLNTGYRDSLNEDVDDLGSTVADNNFVHEEGQWLVDFQWNWQFMPSMNIGFQTRNLFATEPPEQNSARFNQRLREYSITFRYTLAR